MAIDIGPDAIDRASTITLTSFTCVPKDNPANASGIITAGEIWLATEFGGNDCWVGTFSAAGNVLTCRDSESIGSISSGSKQTFSGMDVTVESGDYIGSFAKSGVAGMERDTEGFAGLWYFSGERIDPADSATFTFLDGDAISVYGTGIEPSSPPKSNLSSILVKEGMV